MIGDLRNGMRRIDQHPRGMPETDLIQTVDESIARPLFDEPAEGHVRHAHQLRYLTQRDRLVIVRIHILERLLDPPAVIGKMLVGERPVR